MPSNPTLTLVPTSVQPGQSVAVTVGFTLAPAQPGSDIGVGTISLNDGTIAQGTFSTVSQPAEPFPVVVAAPTQAPVGGYQIGSAAGQLTGAGSSFTLAVPATLTPGTYSVYLDDAGGNIVASGLVTVVAAPAPPTASDFRSDYFAGRTLTAGAYADYLRNRIVDAPGGTLPTIIRGAQGLIIGSHDPANPMTAGPRSDGGDFCQIKVGSGGSPAYAVPTDLLLENIWLHDLGRTTTSHSDGFQVMCLKNGTWRRVRWTRIGVDAGGNLITGCQPLFFQTEAQSTGGGPINGALVDACTFEQIGHYYSIVVSTGANGVTVQGTDLGGKNISVVSSVQASFVWGAGNTNGDAHIVSGVPVGTRIRDAGDGESRRAADPAELAGVVDYSRFVTHVIPGQWLDDQARRHGHVRLGALASHQLVAFEVTPTMARTFLAAAHPDADQTHHAAADRLRGDLISRLA